MRRRIQHILHRTRRVPLFLQYQLSRIGIKVFPFLTTDETGCRSLEQPTPGHFEVGFLEADCIEEILDVEPVSQRSEVERWFREGKLCFGVRDKSRLVAKMWCDLEAFHFPPAYRALEKDEAYLYAACVLPEYRGRHVAQFMRTSCCDALREMGRARFYSYTDYFNFSARRFKETMGVRNTTLQLHVSFFAVWSRTWVLKRYD